MTESAFAGGREDDAGAVVLEFAIIFVLFVTLLWAIISYGAYFATQQNLTHAASEAGRATLTQAAGRPGGTITPAQKAALEAHAENFVATEQLNWHNDLAAFAVVDATVATCSYDANLDCLTVSISYDWKANPIVPVLFNNAFPDLLIASSTIQLSQGQ